MLHSAFVHASMTCGADAHHGHSYAFAFHRPALSAATGGVIPGSVPASFCVCASDSHTALACAAP
eukprot:2564350-Pleurochrysis_carterae.AAC.1